VILPPRALNRAVLARQGLLERRALALPAALDAMAGLQAQYAPSMYIGLWSRVRDLRREAVTEALHERSIVQATLMRATIHLVSAGDFWPLTVAVRDARRQWWKAPPLDEAAAVLRAALADGPLRRKEIEALIGKEATRGVGLYLDLVRVPPHGTWEKRRADLFGLAENWLPRPEIDPLDARRHLVRRYLTGFGPAAKADVANWAGLGTREVEPALSGLEAHEAEDGTTLYDLPGLPLPDPDTPAPVRLLPTWDATLLVHARRALVLPEAFRERIFHVKMPQSIGTFLVDGRVAGTWKPDGTLTPFVALTRRQRAELDREARALAAFSA
jgi:hypothetical protein